MQPPVKNNAAQPAAATRVIVDGGHTLPLRKGDLVEYLCPNTGVVSLGVILVCNQAMLFYITIHDVKKGKEVWIKSQNILRLKGG